ncbi:MAG: hypothetical protein ACYDHH_19530 [Solirubrobacteraceae bacterium]
MRGRPEKSGNGILLLYHHPMRKNAPTVMEHVEAFPRHSRFNVWSVNTEFGCPRFLKFRELDFEIVVLHYSLFGAAPYRLDEYFLAYLAGTKAYKVAFFQDEYHYCTPRFALLNDYDVDCVYTLVEPEHWSRVYGKYTNVPKLVYTIPGYASDALSEQAGNLTKPDAERTIDIGYRGRTLPPYMGRGAQEKADIGRRVLERAAGSALNVDIAVDERSRIYGHNWFAFLANCKATLGTEAGVSIFDTEDVVRAKYEQLVADRPDIAREDVFAALAPWEDNIYYRTISPRHFEAAALRICQILYEGTYSGILEPMVHYIPLAKDFSNWEEVVRRFQDEGIRRELTQNAYHDLIETGQYSYRAFVESFDAELAASGLIPRLDAAHAEAITVRVDRDGRRAKRSSLSRRAIDVPFPGRRALLKPLGLGKVRRAIGRWRYRRWQRSLRSPS